MRNMANFKILTCFLENHIILPLKSGTVDRGCLSSAALARRKVSRFRPSLQHSTTGWLSRTFSTSSARWQTQDTHALAVATSTRGMCQCDGDGTFRAVVSINRLQGKTVATGPRGPLQVDPLLVVCSTSSNYDMIQCNLYSTEHVVS